MLCLYVCVHIKTSKQTNNCISESGRGKKDKYHFRMEAIDLKQRRVIRLIVMDTDVRD